MNTSKYITRTMSNIKIEATAINLTEKTVESFTVTIPDKKYTAVGKEKAIQNQLPVGHKLVTIDSETTETELRGMLISDFIKFSIKLDPATIAAEND